MWNKSSNDVVTFHHLNPNVRSDDILMTLKTSCELILSLTADLFVMTELESLECDLQPFYLRLSPQLLHNQSFNHWSPYVTHIPTKSSKKNQLHNNHNSLAERNKMKEISWRSVKLKLCGVFCSEEIRGHSWYLKADGWFVCDNMWSPARWLPLSVLRTVDGWVRYWLTFCFPAISSACLCDRPPKRSWLPLFYCTCARSKDQREHAFGQWVPLV